MDQKRHAFLLGANGPQSASLNSLKYAERDAERLAAALKASPCAFTNVEWMTAASRETALTKLKHFADQCGSSDLLIVHFSGHGKYDEQLYLICNSTDITNLDASAIGMDAVKRILRKCKARHKVLVLDCCYAGGAVPGIFTRGEQDIKNMLSKELEGSSSIVLSACPRLERARELETLDGGAGFLSWALIASCTTRFHDISPDHCSLTLGDVWRWVPTALAEVNKLLGETEQLPSPNLDSHLEAGVDLEKIWFTKARRELTGKSSYEKPAYNRERFLKALVADHSSFMRDRLSSFVGRVQELKEIRQRIAEKQQTGGYVTITGQAGQGKSSIIAKLVEEYGPQNVAFHFIPFNPGPDHQVGLLRNLMARLILKYDLLDLYVASDSRAALRDYFPKVLEELVTKSGREVVFIDGLDQLEEDATGVRDLSFLPKNPPQGVVFVLGTRPNDALRPLELLKPRYEYELLNLSREDFDLILRHRHVQLDKSLADRFYQAMEGNALYLDLVAKELLEANTSSPEVIIQRVADNPENIFSFTIERLMRQSSLWESVMYPVLGLLLAALEPLAVRHIGQILGLADYKLREGLVRLGGLIAIDGQQRCFLYHLKLRDYLRQDEKNPSKKYVFARHEEQDWHKKLAQWCQGTDISAIWQNAKYDAIEQRRREYARQHYLTHLYHAREWQRLFEVLDTVEYGKAKIHDDPGTGSYAHDLDLGRQAVSWEGWTVEAGIALLPRLWQYTLLRCSLTSRADQYPLVAFRLLVLLERKQEALDLAELLTSPANKVRALLQIAGQIREQLNQEREWLVLLLRVREIARTIEDSSTRATLLRGLGAALVQAQQWKQAQVVIGMIEDRRMRAEALRGLGAALAQAQQWEQAQVIWRETQAVIGMIEDRRMRAEALRGLGAALAQAQQWEQAQAVIGMIEDSYWRTQALRDLGAALAQAQQWEQAQVVIGMIEDRRMRAALLRDLGAALAQAQQWKQAQAVIGMIEDSSTRAEALRDLGAALAQAQQWEQAQAVIGMIEDSYWRTQALRDLGAALVQAQQWEQAQVVIGMIEDRRMRAEALKDLGVALAQAQQWEQAQAVWRETQAVIGTIKISSLRAEALRNLGTALAQAQQWEQAQAVWRETQTVIGMIENSSTQAEALRDLGAALAQAQQWEQAQVIWRETQAVIGTIKISRVQAEALRDLRAALVQAQQWEQARAIIGMIEDNSVRAEALRDLGATLVQAQQWEQAQAVWRETQAVIATTKNSRVRTWALRDLGTALVQAQQWEQAQAVIATIEDSDARAEALRGLAAALAASGEQEQLLDLIQRSWLLVSTQEEALRLFPLVTELIPRNPELGLALYKAFTWVDTFLKG